MKSSSSVSHNKSVKILIVEDEEKLAKHLKKGLQQEGYMVDYSLSGEEAEKYIQLNSDSLDLIILDHMLPGKNGLELCRAVRDQKITVPVLMLTVKDTAEDIVKGLDSGVDDYLTKPFSFEVMLARVRALLRRPRHEQYVFQELRSGNLVLNTRTRKVSYFGKEIPLTLKEFNLLEYLMRNPNKVFEREDILEKIWDINFDTFSNVVDVHIKNLRNKLKEVNGEEILETVRGVGYRFKAGSF